MSASLPAVSSTTRWLRSGFPWRDDGTAAGPAFQEFAGPCFERCERIVSTQLQVRLAPLAAMQNGTIEPEREFIICCLDLISGLAEGIGPPIEALVSRSRLRDLLLQCCQVQSGRV